MATVLIVIYLVAVAIAAFIAYRVGAFYRPDPIQLGAVVLTVVFWPVVLICLCVLYSIAKTLTEPDDPDMRFSIGSKRPKILKSRRRPQ